MKKPSFYISNWMSGVDICKLKRNIDGKQVYVLDDDKDYQFIKDFLNEIKDYIVKGKIPTRCKKLSDYIK